MLHVQNTSSLVLADGESFGAASHYVGYVGYAIIPGLTLDSSNGQKVTAGSPSAKATSDIPFQIPSGATIVGIGGGQNGYFISLFLAFCAKWIYWRKLRYVVDCKSQADESPSIFFMNETGFLHNQKGFLHAKSSTSNGTQYI